jgi:hypothetical protein
MFCLFGCKHKRVASKFLRTPRYDQEVVIEYTICEDCGKQLSCQVKLVPAFKYPESQPKIDKAVTVKVEANGGSSLVIVKPESSKISVSQEVPKRSVKVSVVNSVQPVAPGDTFIKANKKKRNVGRKPSAPTAPAGSTVGNLVKSVYERAGDQIQKPLKVSIQDDLDKIYSKFEDDDEGDNDLQVVRRESPEDTERRFRRAKRREQRKG